MRRGVSALAIITAVSGLAGGAWAQEAAQQVEDIIVTGQRGAIASARADERRADNLTNVVSADSVGQFGDQNTAEALQRLPGVNIERNEGEGRTVSIRGLPSSFTQVTVNGVRVGTSEAGSSTVALDVIPSDLLGRIVVSKTYTPDMDGDTIGGAVELQSQSAFDQPGDFYTFRAEGNYQEYADEWGPEVAGSVARRLMDGDLGLAIAGNYSNRFINGTDLRNEQGLRLINRGGTDFLYPDELNQRFEIGERERFGGTFNLEYRPRDGMELYLRGQFTQLNDDDTRVQQLWQTERSTGNEVLTITDSSGSFNDVRNRYQVFFQPTEDRLFSISGGGEHRFENDWELDYQIDLSRSRWSQEDGLRPRFEIDDIRAVATYGREDLTVDIERESGTRPDPTNPAAYTFVNLLFIEEERTDEITSGRFNIRAPFAAFGEDGYLQFGAKFRSRDKEADKSEFNGDPRTAGVTGSYATLPTFTPDSNFRNDFGPFVELNTLRDLAVRARDALLLNPRFQRQDNTVASDYRLGEDVTAAYVMGNWSLSPSLTLIGGVRVEQTEFSSQGFFFESDDNGLNAAGQPLTAVNLGTYEKDYTDWLPSALIRWEPRDDMVVRASYGRGLKRPDFEDARNSQAIRFDPTNAANTRRLEAGNPFLDALIADQFDASVAFYPSSQAVFQVAVFHKEISDFFLELTTRDITQTPIVLPTGTSTNFAGIETVINGGDATVTGVEFSYSQSFVQLPGVLSGLFVEGNLTLADSEAETSVRPGETFAFPGQADITANLSLGWENDIFSMRVAGNHRGEVLQGIGDSVIEDRYRAPFTQIDINLRWNVTEQVQLYVDGVNLTGEKDTRYYVGGRQSLFERVQDFGSTYQVGVRATF
ncbi:TonB-dependent receptor [Brevundimonas bacteroides]|uniref:TonB-dependent receptor n=1 Tax=Brevundimonas bacteroides TaxID=74311 RepID=UPI000497FAE0|nr:TonB-dependent receptor [Brevundimonas bacteroides]